MKYVKIQVNGVSVTCYEDGSVEKVDGRTGELSRTFGSYSGGYRKVRLGTIPKTIGVHRIIAMALLVEYSEDLQVDHIDGDKGNNSLENLRMVTISQNHKGFLTKGSGCTSTYRGVSKATGRSKWSVRIKVSGKYRHVGHYGSEIEAARSYDIAALKCGYAKEALNFP